MNVGIILLIQCLLTVPFCLKGAAADHNEVYGVLNHSVNLRPPFSQGTPHRIEWSVGTNIRLWWKSKGTSKIEFERLYLFPNGTLKIERLLKSDTGNYSVKIFNEDRILESSRTVTLQVVEPLPLPKLTYNCSKKILSCEVKFSKKPVPSFKLFQDKEEQKKVLDPNYVNAVWQVIQPLKNNYKEVGCEVSISTSLQKAELKLICPGEIDIFLILYIGAGIVVFVIFVAILVCCIRKKKAERRGLEAEERELRPANEALKYRKLPQPPVHAAPSQPHPPQRQPLPCSALQQHPGPPLPRPRPQQKPPRRMKDKL